MAIKRDFNTSQIKTEDIGQLVDQMMNSAKDTRIAFERRWYDNNFFDDGFHFRYLSRTENKVVDLQSRVDAFQPIRAIPKASRQIRGITNLLTANDFLPIVYPEKVNKIAFPDVQDPSTNQLIPNPEYKKARDETKRIAKLSGHWITEEFKNQDIAEKLAHMILLSTKHGVSYMQIWPDAVEEKIRTQVLDAFDVYLLGDLDNIQDQPFVGKGVKRMISEIKANETFNLEQRMKINPDNRYASSEIKEAYMNARHGRSGGSDRNASVILKEFFIKEYVDKFNEAKIKEQENGGNILKNRGENDPVIRHLWVAGNIALRDEYEDLSYYPIVDLRLEPGPMYQTPLIERFIPANKSLDIISSRIERYTNSFPLGVMVKRQGEQANVSNIAGGQVVEYKNIPPKFETQAPLPAHVFNYMSALTSFIEEQGVTTTTLGKLPTGVSSGKAIESLKESEYSNLVVAQRRLKQCVQEIAHRFLDLGDKVFVTPQSYAIMERGEPTYFDVVGKSAIEGRKKLKINDLGSDIVPISKEYKVDIEVQTGLAYTREGQKVAAKELMADMIQLVQIGAVPPQALKVFVEQWLEGYQFGPVAEFMETLEKFSEEGSMTDQQLEAVKVAVLQVLSDAGVVGPEADQKLVDSTKVGVLEALDESGMIDKVNGPKQNPDKGPSKSISFKDLPPSGKTQLARQAGIDIDENEIREKEAEAQDMERTKIAIQAKKGGGQE